MSDLKLNLGCGGSLVTSDDWINLDYAPANASVQQADLLARLPLAAGSVAVVYSSHFIEHVPRSHVPGILGECFRVLRPGGVMRLVLPDIEEMCREYLARREASEHEKADFVVVEMIDQCVRLTGGGELGQLYRRYAADPARHSEMIDYLRARNGEDLRPRLSPLRLEIGQPEEERQGRSDGSLLTRLAHRSNRLRTFPGRLRTRARHAWFEWLLQQLPPTFRLQNVSVASVGERHHWLWDLHQITQALQRAGFEQVERSQFNTSRVADFPFYPLDVDDEGRARKGAESMYVEASKPARCS
ncbi:methyltransferase domain-containing protein [uncultured Thiodictyon sp.]|uniref:class I SAM-dependent methyltransferase n=1 Tax=uncultured Thiodictyon sp. TaxID=1846217 RepID=UPI0025EDAA9C|nr:methyltransferase domain-containing protein [uncultured Thiodictyon sp.]